MVVVESAAFFGTSGDTSDGVPPVNELSRARNLERAPDFGRDADVCESVVEAVLPLDRGRTSDGGGDNAFCVVQEKFSLAEEVAIFRVGDHMMRNPGNAMQQKIVQGEKKKEKKMFIQKFDLKEEKNSSSEEKKRQTK